MNQDIKKLWVEALRSGKFVQGTSKLKHKSTDGNRHCCLGVLCEIHDMVHECPQSFDSLEGFPPEHIAKWAGIPDANDLQFEFVDSYGRVIKENIVYLNDIRMYNFKQIAYLIETQL